MKDQGRRVLLNAAVACALGLPALASMAAEAAPHYAVISLIGDKLNVVVFEPSTGSNIHRNAKQAVPVAGRVFDGAALQAVQDGIKQLQPQSGISLYGNSDPALIKSIDEFMPNGKLKLPQMFMDVFAQDRITHLILVTRRTSEAKLKLLSGDVGDGRLEGVGYYVDPYQKLVNVNTGNSAIGLMAAYSYLRLSLIDLKTGEAVAGRPVENSRSFSASDRDVKSSHVWDSISAERKIEEVTQLIERSIAEALPKVIAKT